MHRKTAEAIISLYPGTGFEAFVESIVVRGPSVPVDSGTRGEHTRNFPANGATRTRQ